MTTLLAVALVLLALLVLRLIGRLLSWLVRLALLAGVLLLLWHLQGPDGGVRPPDPPRSAPPRPGTVLVLPSSLLVIR
ncbi:MAG: hypothetical protein ACKO0M_09670 [Cyanobium sp.]